MNRLRIINSDTKESLIRQIKEVLICRFEAEAELNALNKQETIIYVNSKMSNVPDFLSFLDDEELKKYLQEQLFRYDLVLKNIDDRKIDDKLSL